jgi:hypothetical protein
VKDRRSVDEWADALLDQHRSGPRRSRDAADGGRASLDGAPWMVRLASKLSGEPPDPAMLERARRSRKRHRALSKWEAIVTLIAVAVLCVLGWAALDAFTASL